MMDFFDKYCIRLHDWFFFSAKHNSSLIIFVRNCKTQYILEHIFKIRNNLKHAVKEECGVEN